jgi:glycosyltransferase involved in cell wall biosynthesis
LHVRFLLHDVFGKAGGVKTVTLALARDLAQWHDVELVSLYGGGEPVHRLPEGVRVRTLIERSPAKEPVLRRALSRFPTRVVPKPEPRIKQYNAYTDLVLARYLRSVRDGVVVTMQPGLNIALARLGTSRYLRVAQDHRPFVTRPKTTVAAYDKYADRYDAFLALTDEDTDHYRRLMGQRTRVQTMSNGAPPHHGEPSQLDAKAVVAAGRLEASKGFDLLIEAWSKVAPRHPDWQLRIFGEGVLHGRLSKQIDRLGLTDKVELMGFTTQLQKEMVDSSLFVLSSRAEGYPMVLLEAMGCGVPLVSTDCPAGGPRDIIEEGVDGFLVPNEDVDGLAEAINRALDLDPEARRRMGRAALAKAQERTQVAVARKWSALFTDLENSKRP